MQLELNVYRTKESHNSVMGELWLQRCRWFYTLEPSRLTPVHPGHPCIPAGKYRLVLTRSPHLGEITPELLDVPGRSDIRIHVGNWPSDLLGCTAIGEAEEMDFVENSRVAFGRMMSVLPHYSPIWITYWDGPPPKEDNNGTIDTASSASGRVQEASAASSESRPGNPGAVDFWHST
jgi:hypothetical protein